MRLRMAKPKKKLSRVVAVGVMTHTMCFNCYCHQQNGGIKPYQRSAKRRRAIRYRSRSGLPFKYRFEIFAANECITIWSNSFLYGLMNFNSLCSRSLPTENRATVQAQDR